MASPLENIFITGYGKGLTTSKKPFLIPEQAWQTMENAYTWRDRVLKREGLNLLGRLRRCLFTQPEGATVAAATIINIPDILAAFRVNEPNASLEPGSLVITIAAPDAATFTDNGDGTFAVTGIGVALGSFVNYITGNVHLVTTPQVGGAAITADLCYFPTLPVMGISTQEQAQINGELTIIFDTSYAYIFAAGGFQEYLPATATTWASTDHDFFYTYNYRGAGANIRILFETNFVNSAANPMRFTNGITWTQFQPQITAAPNTFIFTGRIIVAYWSRLLILNTWEGTTNGTAVNFFGRCRFSAEGDPTAATAFRSDIFGQGGFLDAPTSEMIIGAEFIQNTLIVSFERSKWQLRYVGEYGLPFVWERISIDFGSESTFSTVTSDNSVLDIGDKAVLTTTAVQCKRIDLDIPDQIFFIQNKNFGPQRVWGVRDYFKELVFWNYPDATTSSVPGTSITFPNKVLVYNYRNQTWAIFRDSVTAFGYFQFDQSTSPNITWSDLTVFWDDENVYWEDLDQGNPGFQFVICGNQEGYVHIYASKTPDDPSLTIKSISVPPALFPVQFTIPDHNLMIGETIYILGMLFLADVPLNPAINLLPVTTSLNDSFYRVSSVIDKDNITISKWNFNTQTYDLNFPYTFTDFVGNPIAAADVDYIGGGQVALFPKLNIVTQDINIYQKKGMATKLSHIDFLMQPTRASGMTVDVWINSATYSVSGNLTTGDLGLSTVANPAFYTPVSDYSWFRFYTTLSAQYFNINLTYDDNFMNTLSTHSSQWTLYAINAAVKPGGKIMF